MPTVPLYQPGNRKVMRVELSEEQWFALAEETFKTDLTLEQFVNGIIGNEANRLIQVGETDAA
jgi:hypothetical protein